MVHHSEENPGKVSAGINGKLRFCLRVDQNFWHHASWIGFEHSIPLEKGTHGWKDLLLFSAIKVFQ